MTRKNRKPSDIATIHPEAPFLVKGAMRSLSLIAPGLAAWLAADLFMRPSRPKPRSRELQWLKDARPEKLPTRHGDMVGWSWGEGPAVVLSHGWNGRGSLMGKLAMTIAERGFRSVVFDGPAHGRSPGRRTNLINHSAALVDIAANLPDLHGIVGHSFGALAISYRWEELPPLKGVVMISPPADMKIYSRMFMKFIGGNDHVHRKMLDIYRKRFGIVWDEFSVENLAPELEAPLLVIHDRSDRQAPFSHGLRTREAWANARVHETEGLGHLRILRNEDVAEVAAGFMAGFQTRNKPAAGP